MKSKIRSLSAVSAAFTAVALTVGAYFEFTDVFALVISSVFVMLPIYLKSYKGSMLAYLAGGVIAFLCSGFNILSLVFPAYFLFFGVYPIVKTKLVETNFNKYVGYVLGLIWFVLIAYGAYFYYTLIMQGVLDGLPNWINDYVLYALALIAVIFFIIYDRFIVVIKFMIDKYLSRIIK